MRSQLSFKLETIAALAATSVGVRAESVQIGGPLQPGYCRPPLHVLVRPAVTSVYYNPAQIRHA
jgi:hypothetical protein